MSEKDQQPDEQPQTGTAPETAGNDGGNERTFTQEEVDAILRDRLGRERAKYGDYSELKAKAERWSEYEEAQKSELEKLQERVAKAEQAAKETETRARETLLKARVEVEAVRLGFRKPEDAYALANLDGVSFGEDGTIVGLQEALDQLAQDRPYLLAGEPGKPPAPRTNAGEGNPPSAGSAVSDSVRAGVEVASQYGYKLDPKKVAERAKQLGRD